MKKKIFGAFSALLLFLSAAAPTFAATTITISGNGSHSVSSVNVTSSNTKNANQTNNASITNTISQHSNTGGNSNSGNTGGTTTVSTGNANSAVTITNRANLNQLVWSWCNR